MPERWLSALRGEGNVDLSKAKILCDHQILWSLPNVVSQVVSFFGSKAVRGRSESIPRDQWPEVFDTPEYKGRLFRIDEPVVDPVSTIRELARGVKEETYQIDWNANATLIPCEAGISGIEFALENKTIRVSAERYVLAAGAGNGPMLDRLGIDSPQMQLRPLHQLIVRKKGLPDFYSVCVGNGPKPPLVSTTHVDSEGRTVWYIGGDIAEKAGVERSEAEQIEAGKQLFAKLLPWIDLAGAEWFTWRGDRAEPNVGTGDRPPGAFCRAEGNLFVTWPTKLALAPNLADQVGSALPAPAHEAPAPLPLPGPTLGKPPWDLP